MYQKSYVGRREECAASAGQLQVGQADGEDNVQAETEPLLR